MNTHFLLRCLALATGLAASGLSAAAPPTAAEVGDADSFGKKVVWIGLATTGSVILANDCTPDPANPLGPEDRCVVINAAPAATSFTFPDLGRITLPANSANSLICHWATANIFYTMNNPGPLPTVARFSARPTYRVESVVLQDPALINPVTGVAFGGGIDITISGTTEAQTLAAGATHTRQVTGTRTCIAGLVTKLSLVRDYGLTDAMAKKVFQKPITIRVGSRGSVVGVSDATIFYSTRFTADE
jgi:hypothetical protein